MHNLFLRKLLLQLFQFQSFIMVLEKLPFSEFRLCKVNTSVAPFNYTTASWLLKYVNHCASMQHKILYRKWKHALHFNTLNFHRLKRKKFHNFWKHFKLLCVAKNELAENTYYGISGFEKKLWYLKTHQFGIVEIRIYIRILS